MVLALLVCFAFSCGVNQLYWYNNKKKKRRKRTTTTTTTTTTTIRTTSIGTLSVKNCFSYPLRHNRTHNLSAESYSSSQMTTQLLLLLLLLLLLVITTTSTDGQLYWYYSMEVIQLCEMRCNATHVKECICDRSLAECVTCTSVSLITSAKTAHKCFNQKNYALG